MKEVIVISAVWCPSCLLLKKELKKINEEYNLTFKMLDYDLDEDIVNEYNVGNKLPVMIYENKRLIGEKSYEEIIDFLKECKLI
jgi:thiol-disulfide isomerase/thioredoxin